MRARPGVREIHEFFRKAIDLGLCGRLVPGRGILRRGKLYDTSAAHYLHADGELDESRERRADLLYTEGNSNVATNWQIKLYDRC